MSNKYNLYVKLTTFGTEIKIGEYEDKALANDMLNKAVDTWGYGKLIHTTKKGIQVIKIKRNTCKYR